MIRKPGKSKEIVIRKPGKVKPRSVIRKPGKPSTRCPSCEKVRGVVLPPGYDFRKNGLFIKMYFFQFNFAP